MLCITAWAPCPAASNSGEAAGSENTAFSTAILETICPGAIRETNQLEVLLVWFRDRVCTEKLPCVTALLLQEVSLPYNIKQSSNNGMEGASCRQRGVREKREAKEQLLGQNRKTRSVVNVSQL